jgi:hypothetical protein
MLVRVSSIDSDASHAYRLQESFVRDLVAAMPPKDRVRLIGSIGG